MLRAVPSSLALKGAGKSAKMLPPFLLGFLVQEKGTHGPHLLLEKCVEVKPVINPLLKEILKEDFSETRFGSETNGLRVDTETNTFYLSFKGKEALTSKDLDAKLSLLPFTSFITEEDYKKVKLRKPNNCLEKALLHMESAKEVKESLKRLNFCTNSHLAPKSKEKGKHSLVVVKVFKEKIRLTLLPFGFPLEELENRAAAPQNANIRNANAQNTNIRDTNIQNTNIRQSTPGRVVKAHVTPLDAFLFAEKAARENIGVVEMTIRPALPQLKSLLENSITAGKVKNAPGKALLSLGSNLIENESGLPLEEEIGVVKALAEVDKYLEASMFIDPFVLEAADMMLTLGENRSGLRPYQDHFCSLYALTKKGMVNALEPGMGKTICALVVMREKAAQKSSWKGLVVVPAGLKTQWQEEARKFFPYKVDDKVLESKAETASVEPTLYIFSYEGIVKHQEILANMHFDDIVCDEASILRNLDSKRSKALWQIRRNSKCALALTGTPVEKDLQDLSSLLAWALEEESLLKDEHYFVISDSGVSSKNNEALKTGTKKPNIGREGDGKLDSGRSDSSRSGAGKLEAARPASSASTSYEHLGPYVFRRTTKEIKKELPSIKVETVELEENLPELYSVLKKDLLEELREMDQKTFNKERLSLLSKVNSLRLLGSDPKALLETKTLNAEQREMLLKLKTFKNQKEDFILNLLANKSQKRKVLVCTDFPQAALHITQTAKENNIRAGALVGSKSLLERTSLIAAFTEGDLELLTLSSVGSMGLNLQSATDLVHLDLPFSQTDLQQRTARAIRIGGKSSFLNVWVPLSTNLDRALCKKHQEVLSSLESFEKDESLTGKALSLQELKTLLTNT